MSAITPTASASPPVPIAVAGPVGAAPDHTHYIALENTPYSGNSGSTVQAASTKYRPPYVTVSYIIRVA